MAVSGGPDSLALLLMAQAAFPGRVEAATVDHGLRPASGDEACFVARLCAERGIAHTTLSPTTPISGTLQANARAARYALLEQWRDARGIDWLMTAHHADDQIETLVMRINRSSGVGGMAGIRARQGRILRPLLSMRHAALVDLVAAQGIEAIDDPSNRDARFDRARLRGVLNACRAWEAFVDPVAAVATARSLAEADEALEWMADELAAARLTGDTDGGVRLDSGALPPELLRRLLVRALARMEPDRPAPRGSALTAVLTALARGDKAMIGATMITPGRQAGHIWQLRRAAQRRSGG